MKSNILLAQADPVIFDGKLIPDSVVVTNALEANLDNSVDYSTVKIRQGERPDQLSYRLYGTTDFYWTFGVINGDTQKPAWYKSDEEFETHIDIKYGSVFALSNIKRVTPMLNKHSEVLYVTIGSPDELKYFDGTFNEKYPTEFTQLSQEHTRYERIIKRYILIEELRNELQIVLDNADFNVVDNVHYDVATGYIVYKSGKDGTKIILLDSDAYPFYDESTPTKLMYGPSAQITELCRMILDKWFNYTSYEISEFVNDKALIIEILRILRIILDVHNSVHDYFNGPLASGTFLIAPVDGHENPTLEFKTMSPLSNLIIPESVDPKDIKLYSLTWSNPIAMYVLSATGARFNSLHQESDSTFFEGKIESDETSDFISETPTGKRIYKSDISDSNIGVALISCDDPYFIDQNNMVKNDWFSGFVRDTDGVIRSHQFFIFGFYNKGLSSRHAAYIGASRHITEYKIDIINDVDTKDELEVMPIFDVERAQNDSSQSIRVIRREDIHDFRDYYFSKINKK